MSQVPNPTPPKLDVCVCTFRRASLSETLSSLGEQVGLDEPLSVIVADNDQAPSARSIVETFTGHPRLHIRYVHAPAQNISLARNACLDHARAPVIAFIDDDEIARPDWAMRLLDALARQSADIVLGDVDAVYPKIGPAWLAEADLHSIRPTVLADGRIVTGYTCNCAFRREVIEGVRFDLSLGRSGGEDTEFFARLSRSGAKIGHAPQARLLEQVRPERANLAWLLKRSFRAGQTHARLVLDAKAGRIRSASLSAVKLAYCGLAVLGQLGSAAKWRRSAVRGALHAGVVARLIGLRDLQLY